MSHADDQTQQSPDEPRVDSGEKFHPEKFADQAIKFATETAFAAAGLADMVAKKAKELYEQQKSQLAEKTPEGVDPNFKQFVDTMPEQLKTFMDEAEKRLHELSERGRHVVENLQAQTAARPKFDDKQGPFDTDADVDADPDVEHDSVSDPVSDPAAEGGPQPPEGAESVDEAEKY